MTPEITLKLIDALTPLIAMIFCGLVISWYKLHKPRPPPAERRSPSKWRILGDNIVEIMIFLMFIAIAVPDWGGLFLGADK